MIPRTEYTRAEDGVHIAYQVFGDGGADLVFVNRLAATIGQSARLQVYEPACSPNSSKTDRGRRVDAGCGKLRK
jgi:hypothetical protein